MKKRNWLFLLILILALPDNGFGQSWKLRRYEAALGAGPTNSWMDIGPTPDMLAGYQFLGTRPSVVFEARYFIRANVAVTTNLGYLWLGGEDKEGQRSRLFYFNSHIFEPSMRVEYYIASPDLKHGTTALFNRRGMINTYSDFYLYFFGGVGGALSKATVRYVETGEEVTNNPAYNNNINFGLVFPVGIGIKYSLDSYWSLGLELGARLTLTDYLDGYSSSFSQHNDFYYLTNIKAIYKIRTGRNGLPKFKRH